MPDVSILIVHWNTRDRLRRCLGALLALRPSVDHEIVVIDNGSTDGAAEAVGAEFPSVRVLRNASNLGFAKAVNRGMRETRSPFVLLLNPDAEPAAGALEALAGYLREHPGTAAAGAQLYKPDGRRQHSFDAFPSLLTELVNKGLLRRLFPSRFPSRLQERSAPCEVDSLIGACLMLRREAIAQIGPLDERFFVFYEETDWCLRARRAGWRIALVPAARAAHGQGETKAHHPGRARVEVWRSKYAYFDKHRGRAVRSLLQAASTARLTLQFALQLAAGALTLGLAPGLRARAAADGWLVCWHLAGAPSTMGFRPAGPAPGFVRVSDERGVHWLPASRALALQGSPLRRLDEFLDSAASVKIKEGRTKCHYRVTLVEDGVHREWVVKVYKGAGYGVMLKAALRGSKALRELTRMCEAERRGIRINPPALCGYWTAPLRVGDGYLVYEPLDGWMSLDAYLRGSGEPASGVAGERGDGCPSTRADGCAVDSRPRSGSPDGRGPTAPVGGGAADLPGSASNPSSSRRERREVILAFGRFARDVYDAGIYQDDFNPTNVFLRRGTDGGPEFLLVDFERVTLLPVVPRARRLWTVAKMGRVPEWATRTDRVRFLRELMPPGATKAERRAFARELAEAWERVGERDARREEADES